MPEPRRIKAAKPKKESKRRIKTAAAASTEKAKGASSFLKKEVNLPVPNKGIGRLFNMRVVFVPKFLKESWAELKLVHWPNRRETAQLTFAVLAFAIGLGALIAGVDFVLERIFKEVILP